MRKLFAVILSLGLIMAPVPSINTAHASSGGGYLKVILGMANGIVGSTIMLKCPLGSTQFSIPIYFAGSLVFVAAEVFGGKEKKNSTQNNAAVLDHLKANMTEGGDYQRASVEMQIKTEEDNLNHVEKKLKWMNATKVVYMMAAGMAVVEFIWSKLPPPAWKSDIAACKPMFPLNAAAETAITAAYLAGQGYAAGGLMTAGLAGAAPYLAKFLGGVQIGTKLQELSVAMLTESVGRIAFFGAAAVIVTKLASELQSEASRIRENIAKLKQVLAQFQASDNALAEGKDQAGATSGAGNGNDKLNADSKKQYALRNLPKAQEVGKHCFSQSNKGMDYSEGACKSPVKITKPKFDPKFDIPTLKAGANSSIDMAQAIADGDLARADLEAGNLANMAGRIEAINKELMKKANDELKKSGKKPIDINGELKNQIASLNSALNKQSPGSGNYSLADLDSSDIGKAEVSASKPVNGAGDMKAANVNGSQVGGDGIDLSSVEGTATETTVDPNAEAVATASLDDSLNEFESNESDIAKDPEVSIFKQVSNRYFLNYTKLFNRRQIDPPLEEVKEKE
jgi:hypothetical protein